MLGHVRIQDIKPRSSEATPETSHQQVSETKKLNKTHISIAPLQRNARGHSLSAPRTRLFQKKEEHRKGPRTFARNPLFADFCVCESAVDFLCVRVPFTIETHFLLTFPLCAAATRLAAIMSRRASSASGIPTPPPLCVCVCVCMCVCVCVCV